MIPRSSNFCYLQNLKGALLGGSARYVRGRLLTRNEKDFLAVLDEALGSNYRVFGASAPCGTSR